MLRFSQYKGLGYRPPIGAVLDALDWLCEHDRLDIGHIESICLRQGSINAGWSGFIEDNDPFPGPDFIERQQKYRRHSWLGAAPILALRPRKLGGLAEAQQTAWEEEQRHRQITKERISTIEWDKAERERDEVKLFLEKQEAARCKKNGGWDLPAAQRHWKAYGCWPNMSRDPHDIKLYI